MTGSALDCYSSLFQPQQIECLRVKHPQLENNNLELWLLRLDRVGAGLSGNKWFKLKYNLQQAIAQDCSRILSFGGAYSNHLHALAWAGRQLGLETVGVVRGEPEYASNPTLSDARRWGMKLHFVDRKTYRLRYDPSYLQTLLERFRPDMIVPEGGSNNLALKGCREILSADLKQRVRPDLVVLPCGTGGTLAGMSAGHPDTTFLGIPVLNNAGFLYDDIRGLMADSGYADPGNWSLDLAGAEGGYGKTSPKLLAFMADFYSVTGIPLDPVYTGKMLLRLFQLLQGGEIPPDQRILAVHTGGLQGCRGMAESSRGV